MILAGNHYDSVLEEWKCHEVITDVRRPDIIRVGCAALTTRFVDVWDGMHAIADVAAGG